VVNFTYNTDVDWGAICQLLILEIIWFTNMEVMMVEKIVSDEDYKLLLGSHIDCPPGLNAADSKITRCSDCTWIKPVTPDDDGFDGSCRSPKRCKEALDNLKKAWLLIRDNDPFTMYDRIEDSAVFEALNESMEEIVNNGLPIPECPFNQKCFEAFREGE
jgi:hypothetical protein